MQTNFKDLTILYVEDDDIIREQALIYLNKLELKQDFGLLFNPIF